MDFFSNIIKILQFKSDNRENISNMTIAENDCTLETNLNSNTMKCENLNNSIISDDNSFICDYVLHSDEVFTEQTDYKPDSTVQITDSTNTSAVHNLIDLTRQLGETTTAQGIKEFENIINNIQTSQMNIVNDTLSLDDINECLHSNTDNVDVVIKLGDDINDNFKEPLPDLLKHNIINESNILQDIEDNKTIDLYVNLSDLEEYNINDVKGIKDIDIKENILINDIDHTEVKISNLNDIIVPDNEIEDTNDDDGYNSSDFEFITENEAKMYGLIEKYDDSKPRTENDLSLLINKSKRNDSSWNSYSRHTLSMKENGNIDVTDPGEGPSRLNGPTSRYNKDYRQNHSVPAGDDYLNLFRGQYSPMLPVSDIIFLENKSTRPLPMNVQYEGVGFDLQLMGPANKADCSEDEYAEEAKETSKRILLQYPGENRKRRRS